MPTARLWVILFCSCDWKIAYMWPAPTSACLFEPLSWPLGLLYEASFTSLLGLQKTFQLNPSFLTGSSILGFPQYFSVYVPFHVFMLTSISTEDPLPYSPSQLAYTQNPLRSPQAGVASSSFTLYPERNKFSSPSPSIARSKPNRFSSALL